MLYVGLCLVTMYRKQRGTHLEQVRSRDYIPVTVVSRRIPVDWTSIVGSELLLVTIYVSITYFQ